MSRSKRWITLVVSTLCVGVALALPASANASDGSNAGDTLVASSQHSAVEEADRPVSVEFTAEETRDADKTKRISGVLSQECVDTFQVEPGVDLDDATVQQTIAEACTFSGEFTVGPDPDAPEVGIYADWEKRSWRQVRDQKAYKVEHYGTFQWNRYAVEALTHNCRKLRWLGGVTISNEKCGGYNLDSRPSKKREYYTYELNIPGLGGGLMKLYTVITSDGGVSMSVVGA
jgi:hypothetical protein